MPALPSTIQGKSPVPESGPLGSVRGVRSNAYPYRDHRATAVGAHQRKNLIDAGEQQRPGVAGGTTMRRFGGGLRDGRGRRGGRSRREGGDRGAQGRVGGEDAEIAMAVKARRRHQGG